MLGITSLHLHFGFDFEITSLALCLKRDLPDTNSNWMLALVAKSTIAQLPGIVNESAATRADASKFWIGLLGQAGGLGERPYRRVANTARTAASARNPPSPCCTRAYRAF